MFDIIVQAGGMSQRMGENKALLLLQNIPIIQWVVNRLQVMGNRMVITTNDPEPYLFLNLPTVPDDVPGLGALGGLSTALKTAETEFVAVVACDMPFASPRLFSFMYGCAAESNWDVIAPVHGLGFEPLHAIYRRTACLDRVEEALSQGEKRMTGWFDRVNVRLVTPDEVQAVDPYPHIFSNVNTPEDYEKIKRIAAVEPANL